jgi:hypothetical protein
MIEATQLATKTPTTISPIILKLLFRELMVSQNTPCILSCPLTRPSAPSLSKRQVQYTGYPCSNCSLLYFKISFTFVATAVPSFFSASAVR